MEGNIVVTEAQHFNVASTLTHCEYYLCGYNLTILLLCHYYFIILRYIKQHIMSLYRVYLHTLIK